MEFLPVQEHVIVREIPEVQVIERIKEQIGPERTEEQIGDIPVPPFVEETVEEVQVMLHDRLQERTVAPQIQDQIFENVQVIPRELFPEHLTSGSLTFPSLSL